jgi:hypothetical protein
MHRESEDDVPQKWSLSRFLDRQGEGSYRTHRHEIFDTMIQRLASTVPDRGRTTADDATSLNSRRRQSVSVLEDPFQQAANSALQTEFARHLIGADLEVAIAEIFRRKHPPSLVALSSKLAQSAPVA